MIKEREWSGTLKKWERLTHCYFADLMEEFESRVEKFIQVNIESDDCSHWVDILRLEFGGEDKFCGDGFTNAVSEFKRELKTVMIFIIIFLIPLKGYKNASKRRWS